jgi:hypothetical protein
MPSRDTELTIAPRLTQSLRALMTPADAEALDAKYGYTHEWVPND